MRLSPGLSLCQGVQLPESVTAPIQEGAAAGKAVYKLNGTEVGSVDILYESSVEKAGFQDYFMEALGAFLL